MSVKEIKAAVADVKEKVDTLTAARKALEEADIWNRANANEAAHRAEEALRIWGIPVGRTLGWKFKIEERDGR